jgi:hypothetical protein
MPLVREDSVWAALEKCAPDAIVKVKRHRKWITVDNKTYHGFPRSGHGERNPEVELGQVRKLGRFFDILDCMKRIISGL